MATDSERTPTTKQVRHKYATVLDDKQGWRYSEEWAADFDRWLAEHTAATVGRDGMDSEQAERLVTATEQVANMLEQIWRNLEHMNGGGR